MKMSQKNINVAFVSLKTSFSADKKKCRKFKKNASEEVNFVEEYKNDPKYKTELCKTFAETSFCIYGNKCRFAHGKDELFEKSVNHPKYKQKNCMSFFKNGCCIYGSQCHFRHQEKKISQTNRTYYTYLLNLIELNIQEKFKTKGLNYFDEENEVLKIENFRSSNSVSNENQESNSIFIGLIEEKIKQKLKRLPVFSQILSQTNEKDHIGCEKLCFKKNYQMI